MNALNVLCAQLTRDLFAIAKFLLKLNPHATVGYTKMSVMPRNNDLRVKYV